MHACEFMYLFYTSYSLHLMNSYISLILYILCMLWIHVSLWYFIFSACCEFMYLFDTSYSLHVVNSCISSRLHILCMLWIYVLHFDILYSLHACEFCSTLKSFILPERSEFIKSNIFYSFIKLDSVSTLKCFILPELSIKDKNGIQEPLIYPINCCNKYPFQITKVGSPNPQNYPDKLCQAFICLLVENNT